MDDIKGLKIALRSLVVSSPTEVTLVSLLRDYRSMMGAPLPFTKFGYRDPLLFLKERCGDCFLFQGTGGNTVLIPIVPEQLKHIDAFVQKQKIPSSVKYKGKRRSVNEVRITPAPDLVAKTFTASRTFRPRINLPNVTEDRTQTRNSVEVTKHAPSPLPQDVDSTKKHEPSPPTTPTREHITESIGHSESNITSMEAYKNFLRKRLPVYTSNQELDKDSDSGKCTSESEPRTVSSTGTSSSSKAERLEQLKAEVSQLVLDSHDGVLCTDLMKLYRARYGRELNFSQFGLTSVSALALALPGVRAAAAGGGGLRLQDAAAASSPPRPRPRPRPTLAAAAAAHHTHTTHDADDALPWIDFDPDVFPADCVSFSESIPAGGAMGAAAGDMVELMVGEVYSPSHFWYYRLGEQYHIAMETMMDEMTEYYERGSGRSRALALGAVRVGHYCSSVFERDWHRSLIVQILDSDTVKVRHVDYGTVDRAAVSSLRPLLRRWATLPAQAVRARLAGVRPAAGGRCWPRAAAAAFLRHVRDTRLVGNVVHTDTEENIVELFLINTSTARDIRVDVELIRGGHADPRGPPAAATPAAGAVEPYLYPRFCALESGAAPNYAEISAWLSDGIAPECVDEYRRHALCVPPPPPEQPPLEQPSPPRLDNRVPLFPLPAAVDDAPIPDPAPPSVLAPATAAVAPCSRRRSPSPPRRSSPPPRAAQCVAPERRPPVSTSTPTPAPAPAQCPVGFPPMPPMYPAPPMPFFLFPPTPPMHPPMPPMLHMPSFHCSTMSLAPPPRPRAPPGLCSPAPAPPAPPAGPRSFNTGQGEVTLSVSECEIFSLLSSVDPTAAHWYMVDAISRARAATTTTTSSSCTLTRPTSASTSQLNPDAHEFRLATTETQTEPAGGQGAPTPAVRHLLGAPHTFGVRAPPGFTN